MYPETNSAQSETAQELKTWHKPQVERLEVVVDTGEGTASGGDGLSKQIVFESDMRLKESIADLDNAMPRLFATSKPGPQILVIPILVETIKEQQLMLADLRTEIDEIRRKSAA